MKDKTHDAIVNRELALARAKQLDAISRTLQFRLFLLSLKEVRLSLRLLTIQFGKAMFEGLRYIVQLITHTDPELFGTSSE